MKSINVNENYFSILHEVSKVLSRQNNIRDAFKSILKLLYSYLDIPASFIALYNPIENTLEIKESFGLLKKEKYKGVFRVGEGIVGSVFKNEIPAIIHDPKENKDFLNKMGILNRFDFDVVFIGTVIKIGGEKLGVLGIYKEKTRNLSYENEIKLLSMISILIGFAQKMNEKLEFQKRTFEQEKEILLNKIEIREPIAEIIGVSKPIDNLKNTILKVANVDSTVLLEGESGTGKSLVAKVIHKLSSRKKEAFVSINCASIPENLLEAELFGYEKGAFSGAISQKKGKFEIADKGTIFLDEIGDIPLSLQGKLLTVIQEKEFSRLGSLNTISVDVRIIAATNKNLYDLVNDGKFREDLYYRLNVIPIKIPPLIERKEDIPILIDYFLKIFNEKYNKSVQLSKEVLIELINYNWPGNVRELENIIERLVVMNDHTIYIKDLPAYISQNISLKKYEIPTNSDKNLPNQIQNIEKKHIELALRETGFVKSKAARLLNLTLRQLDYRIHKYNIKLQK
ncbi:MAG: sigma 54-interacting transcriptional regulator [Desulfurella sp.]|uniref:sigma-54-dependent Fis family transcriptional regulator n=1 Tax=Desulfurella sp. TaxID=1962857 RepID=UPI003D0AEDD4